MKKCNKSIIIVLTFVVAFMCTISNTGLTANGENSLPEVVSPDSANVGAVSPLTAPTAAVVIESSPMEVTDNGKGGTVTLQPTPTATASTGNSPVEITHPDNTGIAAVTPVAFKDIKGHRVG